MNDTAYKLDRAIFLLKKAEDSLSGAKLLGIWDILGGGMFSSIFKHSAIHDAKRYAEEADSILSSIDWTFLRAKAPDMDVGSILTVLDCFFDSFIADIFVQSKISKAKREIEDMIRTLSHYRSLI